MALAGRVMFVTGGSRGIGLAIAIRAAKDGAKVIIAAKTAEPHPKLPGTIHSSAKAIEAAGGEALPLLLDVRDEQAVDGAVAEAVAKFGGIDILVNNASAISNTPTLDTSMKRYDLMHTVNGRGTFLVTKTCLPHLLRSRHAPHVLTLSPPLNLDPRWISMAGPAYTAAKYSMSLYALGWAEEFRGKVASNALWPRTAIATAAIEMLAGKAGMLASRQPEIMAEAAHAILSQDVSYTGNFCIDDDTLKVLKGATDADIAKYNNSPMLMPDFYVGEPDAIKRWMDAGSLVSKVAGMFSGGKRA